MKTLGTCLLLVTIASLVFGQTTGKIAGRILDANGDPLVGANVVVTGTSLGAAAGTDGTFFVVNVPPGVYAVRVSLVGYSPHKTENVSVSSGLTTRLEVRLSPAAVNLAEVVVSYTRPPVQKDLTSKRQAIEATDLEALPVAGTISNLLTRQAGITADIVTTPVLSQPMFGLFATLPTDGLHFRGGRTNETSYLFDGINVTDELWGGFNLDAVGTNTLETVETFTGTFGPQFGNAMSGVVLLSPVDVVPQKFRAKVSASSDGSTKMFRNSMNTYDVEGSVSSPLLGSKTLGIVLSGRMYSTDGYLFGYLYPDYIDSGGKDKAGEPEKVPMGFKDTRSVFGKLLWQIDENMKLRTGFLTASTAQGSYHHYFKYNPYGTPHTHTEGYLAYAKFTHLLTSSTFYDLAVSYYRRDFRSHVWDDSASYAVRGETGTAEFSINGEDYVHIKSKFDRLQLTLALSSQITRQHNLNLSVSASRLTTAMRRLNPTGWYPIEDYDYKPMEGFAYVNDKMEFDDIGMVVNLGGRVDYINANWVYLKDITLPNGGTSKVKPHIFFSPRLGISYPVSDVAAFRFGYGYYYQYPAFYQVFEGTNRRYSGFPAPDITETMGAVSKGDLEPEKTINYEAGVQVALSPALSLDVTGFYRKTSNLIGITVVHGYVYSQGAVKQQDYRAFDNVNFATVKGIELSLQKKFTGSFSGFLDYTYAQSLVSSSLVFSMPTDISRTFPSDWDQTHTISFGANFSFPSKWGFSLLGNVSNGLPYTYTAFQPNALRAPLLSGVDLKVFKEFDLFDVDVRVFLQVTNLLNRQNVYWVYPSSGRAGQGTDPAYSDDFYNNPSAWGPPRNIQLGVSMSY